MAPLLRPVDPPLNETTSTITTDAVLNAIQADASLGADPKHFISESHVLGLQLEGMTCS